MKQQGTFEEHLRKSNLSENTITSYLWTVEYCHAHYDAISKENLLAYKGYLMEFYKPKTVNLRIQAINKYLVYLGKDKLQLKAVKVQQKNFLENVISNADYSFLKKQLNNDGEVLIFPRSKLNSYLVNFVAYFPDNTDYVAIGSKRRKEANDAYRLFNDSKHIASFAKYLEQNGCNDIAEYCKMIKTFINQNIFSCHRKIFLACDSIHQYEDAVRRFLEEEDVQASIYVTDVNAEDVLDAYVLFLIDKMNEIHDDKPADEAKKNAVQKQNEELCQKNGKITKITDQELLHQIEPYLNTEYKTTIPAMNIVRDFYQNKYPGLKMEIKDWMNLVTHIDWSNCY